MQMNSRRKWYSRLLFLIVLVAVGWFIYENIGDLKAAKISFNRTYLALSFVFAVMAHLSNLFIWKYLASSFNLNADFIMTGKSWFLSRLGRFVPGKITILLVRFDLYKGHSKKMISAATIIEYVSSLASAGLIILISILTTQIDLPLYFRLAALGYVILLFTALFTKLIHKVINKGLTLLKKEPIDTFPSPAALFKYVIWYFIPILLYGLSFYFLINSVSDIGFEYYLTLTGVYYSAGLIGLVVLFAPSGIGVREGILFLILPLLSIPKPIVIVVAIMIRLIALAGEILLAGIFTLAEKISCSRSSIAR